VDLNAPYQSTTVVFGLLDPVADTQWIKINKTFLGDGNNLDYAQIRDSSEYAWEEFNSAVVQRISNGTVTKTYTIQDTVVTNKNVNGIFYGPEQTLYYIVTTGGLSDTEASYKLKVDFKSRPDIESTTNLVKAQTVNFQTPQPGTFLSMAQYNTVSQSINYNDNVNIKWTPVDNVDMYDLTIRFSYTEEVYADDAHTQLLSTTPQVLEYNIGKYTSDNLTVLGGYLTIEFGGESFFSYLSNKLKHDPKIRRIIGTYDGQKTRCFEIVMAMANDELRTYMEVNAPVTGVVSERPNYTNVTNGLGLFASRSSVTVENLAMVGSAMQMGNLYAFMLGDYCADLNFCDPNPTSDFSCQ
jgi:hypothetical protein